ncbi:hypothetical protein [Cytobacillus gottheilii]|uniref:hypothetical protein n=1 Tax=Cytobacillus gottheilii TaxID=859144 RepID=UPI0009BC236D|nr:hypothetical protein [Cytobacillus gottheilii]
MEVLATARLEYNIGESIGSGWEGLYLNVKFKEKGKYFKTRLNECLASTFNVVNSHLVPSEEDRYASFDEYYEDVEYIISNEDLVKKVAEKMIKEYYSKLSERDIKNNQTAKMADLVNKSPKIEVKVTID